MRRFVVRQRSEGAKARNRGQDHRRIPPLERLVADAGGIQRLGRLPRDHHIVVLHQAGERFAPLGRIQVQRHAALAGVEKEERRAGLAPRLGILRPNRETAQAPAPRRRCQGAPPSQRPRPSRQATWHRTAPPPLRKCRAPARPPAAQRPPLASLTPLTAKRPSTTTTANLLQCPPPKRIGSLAQSVEHRAFNPLVLGSSPRRPTKSPLLTQVGDRRRTTQEFSRQRKTPYAPEGRASTGLLTRWSWVRAPDGPPSSTSSEGRHSAFPGVPSGAPTRICENTSACRRLGKAECLPSRPVHSGHLRPAVTVRPALDARQGG